MLERLFAAGMNVARLNFSHGTHEAHAQVIATLRDLARRKNRPLAILQDLSGPKVRLGALATPTVTIKRGQEVGFIDAPEQESAAPEQRDCLILPLPVPELLAALKRGHTLLLDDGKLALKVTRVIEGSGRRVVWARAVVGGELKPRKGVTAPGVSFELPAVTEKDKDDLRFGL